MTEITVAIIGLLLSSLFASTEAAFLSFNKIKLDIWKKEKRKFINSTDFFVKNPEEFFTTILLGNNFSNIIYTTFATIVLLQYYDEFSSWLFLTFIVLFFGEIYPKTLARRYSDRIILKLLFIIRGIFFIAKPLVVAINAILSFFMRYLKLKKEPTHSFFSRGEVEFYIQQSSFAILKHRDERKYVDNALDFSEVKVRESLTPRTEVIALEIDDPIEKMEEIVKKYGHSRIPVYKDDIDNIVGVVFMYDLLEEPNTLKDIIKPIKSTFENKSCAVLLKEFQKKNISIAIVLDEYGGLEGIVTSTDLIEVIFGEFYRHGEDGSVIKKLNQFTYEVDARIDIDELIGQIQIEIPEGEYETLAGFILNKAGRILQKGDSLDCKKFKIEVLSASPQKINKIKIILKGR
jgi:CBS domain containing-hemolysin-like protein